MSLKLNSSGGGSVTLQEPVTASTLTLTLPAFSGTAAALATVTNNGVLYVNSSGQPTSGSALTFDGTNFGGGVNVLVSDNKAIGFGSNAYWLGNSASGFIAGYINGSEQMRLTSTGLGIGTTSPASATRLTLDYPGFVQMVMRSSGTDRISLYGDASVSAVDAKANPLAFYAGSSERARIDSSGNLLVGTTAGGAKFYILSASGVSSTNARFDLTGASLTVTNVWSVYTGSGNNTNNFRHFAAYSGDIGQDCFRVYGQGNVVNINNSYGALSDSKLKENIVDASPKLADLMQVRVRNYNLKSDPKHKQLGVIAQELEAVFPALIEESPDVDLKGKDLGTTTKQVKYSVFVPMLIKAIQELKAEFDAYKSTHP
jgi:hypothetical protein